MNASRFETAEAALKAPAHEVVDLTSDEDGGSEAEVAHPPTYEGPPDEEHHEFVSDEEFEENEAWETQSLFEDALEEMGDQDLLLGDEDACTLAEAENYRQLLRRLGPVKFCEMTVENDSISAKKLLTAFGIRPPAFLEGAPDEAYYGLLSAALNRELSKRVKLPQHNTVDDAVELLKRSKNIIVLAGAGISTSLGIPDFRSKDTGLYSKLEHLGLSDPQEVFDIDIFREDPNIFYSIAKDILPTTNVFSPTHAFIALLQEKNVLRTCYTQNIDNLEAKAGIEPSKLIQCHGSFATASCVKCKAQVPGEAIYDDVRAGRVPRCKRCIQSLRAGQEPQAMKRKRSKNASEKKRARDYEEASDSDSEEYEVPAAGVMKPDITFFGEALPDTFSDRLTKHDRDVVDLVIVIGTSLKVAPVSEVVPYLPSHIPQMYISREPVSHVNFDIDLLGDCDVVVAELCRRVGWDLNHEMIPKGQEVEVTLFDGFTSRHKFVEKKALA